MRRRPDALRQAALLDPDDFARYGITGDALDDIRSRFAAWRRDLRDGSEPDWSHDVTKRPRRRGP